MHHAPDGMKRPLVGLDEQGVKMSRDARIEGTPEATRHHLEDLRKSLKLCR